MTSLNTARLVELVKEHLSFESGYPVSAINISFDVQARILTMTIDLSGTPSSGPKVVVGAPSLPSPRSSSCIDIYPSDICGPPGSVLSDTSVSDSSNGS